jgi:lipopolysaccharide/colanic/teichoic acid biosynthesis glycosyltransferase
MQMIAAPSVGTSFRATPKTSLALKRLIDIVLSVFAGLVMLPLIAIAALAVELADPGPAFFIQQRLGRHGRRFGLVKLRTMRHDADKWLADYQVSNPEAGDPRVYKSAQDPRIIPKIGVLLRRYSVDELPQIWNVIRGDLSLVGPRPLPDYHARLLDPEFLAIRSQLRPGVTGLWQLESRSNAGPEALTRWDRQYLNRCSLGLDLVILCRTVVCVMRGSGI